MQGNMNWDKTKKSDSRDLGLGAITLRGYLPRAYVLRSQEIPFTSGAPGRRADTGLIII